MKYATEQERIDAKRASKIRWREKNREWEQEYTNAYKRRMKNNIFVNASERISRTNNVSKKMGYSPITCSKGRVMAIMATQTECCHCGAEGRLNLDHCHTTGRVRGMLCQSCNAKDVLK